MMSIEQLQLCRGWGMALENQNPTFVMVDSKPRFQPNRDAMGRQLKQLS